MIRLGFNIASYPNWVDDVLRLRPPVLLVRHHDPFNLWRIKNALPKTVFICRPFPDFDYPWRLASVEAYGLRILSLSSEFPYDAYETPNEPNPQTLGEALNFIAWCRALLIYAEAKGIYIALGAFAPQSMGYDPNHTEWAGTAFWKNAGPLVNHPRVRFITAHEDYDVTHPASVETHRHIRRAGLDGGKVWIITEGTVDRSNDGKGWREGISADQMINKVKSYNLALESDGYAWACHFTDSTEPGWTQWQRQGTGLAPLWESWVLSQAPAYPLVSSPLPPVSTWPYPNFPRKEFKYPDMMSRSFLGKLQAWRTKSGIPFRLTSDYRPGDPRLHGRGEAVDGYPIKLTLLGWRPDWSQETLWKLVRATVEVCSENTGIEMEFEIDPTAGNIHIHFGFASDGRPARFIVKLLNL